jgi:PelA/Pel-15E family pectate lyase
MLEMKSREDMGMKHDQRRKICGRFSSVLLIAILFFCASLCAAPKADSYLKNPDDWFAGAEGRRVADNILSWQTKDGIWPKNTDTTTQSYSGRIEDLKGIFDNSATTGELRFLARSFRVTKDDRYRTAFERGLDTILKVQYPTGGWPQAVPPGSGYSRHITFNDDAMVRLMNFVLDVARSPGFDFVDADRRTAAAAAFDRGIDCILKCQIVTGGKKTVWCAQHDEKDLRPRPARSYELPSLSGAESAPILRLLMSLGNPSPAVVEAVESGVQWYQSAKLTGIRQDKIDGNKVIIKDPAAEPLWARFYEIETGRPFFCGRDGVKKYDISQIEAERRNGYAWYGDWGQTVFAEYAKWKQRIKPSVDQSANKGSQ